MNKIGYTFTKLAGDINNIQSTIAPISMFNQSVYSCTSTCKQEKFSIGIQYHSTLSQYSRQGDHERAICSPSHGHPVIVLLQYTRPQGQKESQGLTG